MATREVVVKTDLTDTDTDGPFRARADNEVVEVPIVKLTVYTVATAPTGAAGQMIYVSDGDAGDACVAVHNGSVWTRILLGAEISAV